MQRCCATFRRSSRSTLDRLARGREYALRVYRVDRELLDVMPSFSPRLGEIAAQRGRVARANAICWSASWTRKKKRSCEAVTQRLVDEIVEANSRRARSRTFGRLFPDSPEADGAARGVLVLNAAFFVAPDSLTAISENAHDVRGAAWRPAACGSISRGHGRRIISPARRTVTNDDDEIDTEQLVLGDLVEPRAGQRGSDLWNGDHLRGRHRSARARPSFASFVDRDLDAQRHRAVDARAHRLPDRPTLRDDSSVLCSAARDARGASAGSERSRRRARSHIRGRRARRVGERRHPLGARIVDGVRDHDAVVEAALDTGTTPVPARFGQRFDSDDACREALRNRAASVESVLADVQGSIEMTLIITPSTRRMIRDLEPVLARDVRRGGRRPRAADISIRCGGAKW